MTKTPVRGMRDILPSDMKIRDYLLGVITKTASLSGFDKIETPAVEHLGNLSTGDGGDNEKLIFKILKRGEELKRAIESGDEIADSALRYDLTVPLARYVAANAGSLAMPFKSLQIGPVWRADAPQKGRFRQFMQCDMDIIGDSSILAEIDVLTTGVRALAQIAADSSLGGVTLHINDRRILIQAARWAGFNDASHASVLITLDKNDKIGLDGVHGELLSSGLPIEAVDKFVDLFRRSASGVSVGDFNSWTDGDPDNQVVSGLQTILNAVSGVADNVKVVFNPSLVRGMGYYTGPIFEATADGLGSSIAGGGRYDKMIGKFSGQDIAACGFSIGFERLVTILQDKQFTPPQNTAKKAILVGKKVAESNYAEILARAEAERTNGAVVSIIPMARNLGHQLEQLAASGYTEFDKIYGD